MTLDRLLLARSAPVLFFVKALSRNRLWGHISRRDPSGLVESTGRVRMG